MHRTLSYTGAARMAAHNARQAQHKSVPTPRHRHSARGAARTPPHAQHIRPPHLQGLPVLLAECAQEGERARVPAHVHLPCGDAEHRARPCPAPLGVPQHLQATRQTEVGHARVLQIKRTAASPGQALQAFLLYMRLIGIGGGPVVVGGGLFRKQRRAPWALGRVAPVRHSCCRFAQPSTFLSCTFEFCTLASGI